MVGHTRAWPGPPGRAGPGSTGLEPVPDDLNPEVLGGVADPDPRDWNDLVVMSHASYRLRGSPGPTGLEHVTLGGIVEEVRRVAAPDRRDWNRGM